MGAIEGEAASTTNDENNVDEMSHEDQNNDNPVDDINGQNDDDVVGNSDEDQEAIDDNEMDDEERITIDDINIVSQMNTSQMALEEEEQEQRPAHTYNLRHHPTRRKQQVSLAITENDKMTGVANEGQYTMTYPKIHAHVILTQMNVKEGLLTFGEKGNEAILKELRQLHQKNALLPIN